MLQVVKIATHAPVRGATVVADLLLQGLIIATHAPVRGATEALNAGPM